jgi:hypothetical protein
MISDSVTDRQSTWIVLRRKPSGKMERSLSSPVQGIRLPDRGESNEMAVADPHSPNTVQEYKMREDEDLGVLELEDNLHDVEKPAEVPAGVYTAEVQDVQKQTSAGKGNQYYAIKLVIPEGELPADIRDDFPDGAVLYWNRQLVPKKGDRRSLFNLRKLIEAFGLDSNTNTIDPNDWMGCRCRVKIRHRPWEGEMRAEIGSIEAAEVESRKVKGKAKAVEEDEEEEEEEKPVRGRKAAAGRRGR